MGYAPFTQQVLDVIRSIPAGRVATYGQVAGLAGSPRAARQVVRILHTLGGPQRLPWHRVVNGKGEIALQDEPSRFMQQMALEDEGVEVDRHGRIELETFLWRPGEGE